MSDDPLHKVIDAGSRRRELDRKSEDEQAAENMRHLKVYDDRTHVAVTRTFRGTALQLAQELHNDDDFLSKPERKVLAEEIMREDGK